MQCRRGSFTQFSFGDGDNAAAALAPRVSSFSFSTEEKDGTSLEFPVGPVTDAFGSYAAAFVVDSPPAGSRGFAVRRRRSPASPSLGKREGSSSPGFPAWPNSGSSGYASSDGPERSPSPRSPAAPRAPG